jgi:glutaconyl-CoA decarboxylase
MKNYTITVNGKVYEVTVEEGFTGNNENRGPAPVEKTPVKPAAPAAAAPKPVAAGSVKINAWKDS